MVLTYSKLPSQRQLRVAEQIRQLLAQFFINAEIYHPALVNSIITVLEVKVSADLRIATVFIKISPTKLAAKEFKHIFMDIAVEGRRLLASSLNLRYAPELRFLQDDPKNDVEKLDMLFRQITDKPES